MRWSQHDPIAWGVGKRPVAAGRGSAGFEFAIDPGHPERSILLYRLRATDPGVMMPETGRQLVDERGAALKARCEVLLREAEEKVEKIRLAEGRAVGAEPVTGL